MADSQSDCPHSQPDPKNHRDKSSTSEDEINLIDYFAVLWRRKYFIVLGTALPTLVVGLAMFFSPCDYKVTYSYDLGLDEKDCKVLLDQFYDAENGEVLAAKLKEAGFDEYAMAMSNAGIKLEVSGTFLIMTVAGSSPDDVQKTSFVVRNNFEEVLPVYSVKKKLGSAIAEFRTKMAGIEENEFDLELELESKKAVLARLKNLEPEESGKISDNIVLQFENVRQNSEYLPLAYQIRATDANIVNIEETISLNQKKCEHYKTLQSLNERLLEEVNSKAASYYTLGEFRSFLANVMSDYEDGGAAGYLRAYIKRIENTMATTKPVVGKPGVYRVPKGTGRRTGTMFAVLLMVTILAAFLLENIPKKQAQAA
ncbi:MAG: hypothetical protein ABIF19_01880 [Planctomycetota bacterium]